jgi:hypothetical protein
MRLFLGEIDRGLRICTILCRKRPGQGNRFIPSNSQMFETLFDNVSLNRLKYPKVSSISKNEGNPTKTRLEGPFEPKK